MNNLKLVEEKLLEKIDRIGSNSRKLLDQFSENIKPSKTIIAMNYTEDVLEIATKDFEVVEFYALLIDENVVDSTKYLAEYVKVGTISNMMYHELRKAKG